MRATEVILIAKDHESIREMARQSLLQLGYKVESAGYGEEALRLVGQERPALPVLDVIMPKLGRTAVATQRRFPDMPVIFTSGYSQDRANLLHGIGPTGTGRRTCLQKPHSASALSKLVRNVLDIHAPKLRW